MNTTPTDSAKTSRLAQGAFVLGWLAGFQFLLHFCPALAREWDGVGAGDLDFAVACCVALTTAGMVCGLWASFRIWKSQGTLKGWALAIAAILVCLGLLLWMFSGLRGLARHQPAPRAASLVAPGVLATARTAGSMTARLGNARLACRQERVC